MNLVSVEPVWQGRTVIVAAPGPSLTPEVADGCRGVPVIAVQDAWRRIPWADALYGCDLAWWKHHKGAPEFAGRRWSTHDTGNNGKSALDPEWGVALVEGRHGEGFLIERGNGEMCQCSGRHNLGRRTACKFRPAAINYGRSSGFQATNLALLFGATRVVLVGFDLRRVDGRAHFFGNHPKPLRDTTDFKPFVAAFRTAAKALPEGVEIINTTPGSALQCFPMMSLDEALGRRIAA